MIQKLINHWTERPSRVLAESLRIPIQFEVEQRRSHQAPSWFRLVPSSTRSKLGEPPGGRGEVRRWGVAKESEQYYRGVKAFFTVDLPDFKIFLFNFFLSHVSKNIKLACCYTGIPSLDAWWELRRAHAYVHISTKFILETAKTFISSFNQSMNNTGSQTNLNNFKKRKNKI